MYTFNGGVTQKEQVRKLLNDSPLVGSGEFSSYGIDTKTLSRMVEDGEVIRVARGLYASANYVPGTQHSVIESSRRVRSGVVCLLSALSFHEIGTQNPSEVWLAVPRGSRYPRLPDQPIVISVFSREAYRQGIEEHSVDGVNIRVYNEAKTVADCFKYRNKIGLDVSLEALREVIRDKRASVDEVMRYARVCRVLNVMRPYPERLV